MSKKLKYIMSADITKDDLYGEKLPNKQQIVAYLTKFKAVTKSDPRAGAAPHLRTPRTTPRAPSPMHARALWTENPRFVQLDLR